MTHVERITSKVRLSCESKFLDNTNCRGIMNAKRAVPLRYLSNFWWTLGMP